MKEKTETIGIGLEEIICQSKITNELSSCERQAIMLLYYRIINQRTVPVWFQVRSSNFNEKREAVLVNAGLFNFGDEYLGEAILIREYNKDGNYRPWKLLPGKDERDRYEDGRSWPSQIKGLIVTVENPCGTLHLWGIGID